MMGQEQLVSGKNQGLSAHVLTVNPNAPYTHCSYHRLNLAVVTSCGEQRVQNLMSNIKDTLKTFDDFKSKHQKCLK